MIPAAASVKPGRAKPLGRDERRSAILDATIPLLIAHGRDVTSKQIAAAAGIAEGTIYRVFADKEELLAAALHRHMDGGALAASLLQIPPAADLDESVATIVSLLQVRVRELFGLMVALDFWSRPRADATRHNRPDNEAILGAVADVLARHADELRVPPRRAAQMIRLTTLSMTHPLLSEGENFTTAEIAALLLHGLTASAPAQTHTTAPSND
ncbi:TetR/AcrR family transcriptional regulator [Microterricola viridarii]|uniref:DNA-binding transcriptional regulator, AcrR family n=1 Tax=Microterricola viridarii TaxID=412690 RepID=A0A1H1RMM3_9MICO|nr:TetR family transcriptional regulator [Microterricola viridarii]SDS37021.1 DNA-binding transcriptional regulator, AcrR family [Microterricola viridarii]